MPRHVHPRPDELVALLAFRSGHQGMNAAAAGVSHDDDVLNVEMLDGILERRAHAVPTTIGSIWRYEVGYVAHDKEISGAAVRKKYRVYSERLKKLFLRVIPAALKATEAGSQPKDERMLMSGAVCADDVKRHAILEKKEVKKYRWKCSFPVRRRQERNSPLDRAGEFYYLVGNAKGSNWDHESRAMSTAWSVRFWHCRQPV